MQSIGAAIVHFENFPEVLDTIADIQRAGVNPSNIYFVDNGSRSSDIENLSQQYPSVRVITGQGNVGYAAAVNLGAKAAASDGIDLLLVVTHEVRLDANVCTALSAEIRLETNIAVAAPVIHRKSNPREGWSAGGDLSKSVWPTSRSTWRSEPPEWVDGCCFMVDLTVYWELGGMYEPYFLYMEEVDFFQRLIRNGHQIKVVPSVRAYQEPGDLTLYLAIRNRLLLARRLGPSWLPPIIALVQILKIPLEAARAIATTSARLHMRAWGVIDGITVPKAGLTQGESVENYLHSK